jgi:hypothetical protein
MFLEEGFVGQVLGLWADGADERKEYVIRVSGQKLGTLVK